jgi:hypothetical protein
MRQTQLGRILFKKGRMLRCNVFPVSLFLFIAIVMIGQSCSLPAGNSAPLTVFSRSITLAWDPPGGVLPGPYALASYFVYWRPHLGAGWRFLARVPARDAPEVRVEHDVLGDGVFDFAVMCMDESGNVSPIHSSLDAEADPVGGWYVIWVGSD